MSTEHTVSDSRKAPMDATSAEEHVKLFIESHNELGRGDLLNDLSRIEGAPTAGLVMVVGQLSDDAYLNTDTFTALRGMAAAIVTTQMLRENVEDGAVGAASLSDEYLQQIREDWEAEQQSKAHDVADGNAP